jgi:hypothetical protein
MTWWKRALVLAVATAALGGPAPAAHASGPRPQILSAEWVTRPVTALALETLEIRALDPDGVVTTVNVSWGDGPFDHADLICFDQSEVAEVRLTHVYRDPGVYSVQILVGSGPRCFTVRQHSRVEEVRTVVFPEQPSGYSR